MQHHSAGATIQVANFVNHNRHPQAPTRLWVYQSKLEDQSEALHHESKQEK